MKIFGKKFVKKKQPYEKVNKEIQQVSIAVIINKTCIKEDFIARSFA